jgi:hypothetical protein
MGECLEDTYRWVESKDNKCNYTIIHAIVERKIDCLRHPHAVIYNKNTGNIHEVSNIYKKNNVVIPFLEWVKLGKVSNIKQYSFEEYQSNLLKCKKWDFWDLEKDGVIPKLVSK